MNSRDKSGTQAGNKSQKEGKQRAPEVGATSLSGIAEQRNTSRKVLGQSSKPSSSKSPVASLESKSRKPMSTNRRNGANNNRKDGSKKHSELNNKDDLNRCQSSLNEMPTTSCSFPVVQLASCNQVQETNVDSQNAQVANGTDSSSSESSAALLSSSMARREGDDQGEDGTDCESASFLTEKEDLITKNTNSSIKEKPAIQSQHQLPPGWEQHSDKNGLYYWHLTTGVIQRDRPTLDSSPRKSSLVLYHDDEEINQVQRVSSDEDDEYYESGAALTLDETATISESAFVVYPLGRCKFDEAQLGSATSSKAIQRCILRLSNRPTQEESSCWGLNHSQPILMKIFDEYIQFTDISTQNLLRNQPIPTIKSWAVDDDNNFAFVVEEQTQTDSHRYTDNQSQANYLEAMEEALLSEPNFVCYVFSSNDDDDMSCKVAAKLNEQINRHREIMNDRITKVTRIQQMVEPRQAVADTGEETDEIDEELEASSEMTIDVKYIGKTPVTRPVGIDILNIAIDKCLADASKAQADNLSQMAPDDLNDESLSPLIEAKLHISPSSVIVENVMTGEIIVECRIRYLTFMGISKRDIRWCGFIMQNSNSKTFMAHCFECHPTAGHVCELIQLSCSRMYEKVVKNARQAETLNIIPTRSRIRNTIAKTFSRIKLNPMISR